MQLTRFTDIGLRVVMRLAVPSLSAGAGNSAESTTERQLMTTKDLAAELAVPYTHVAKVVVRLSELGVVHARRGRSGGLTITDLGQQARIGWLAAALEGDHDEVVDCDGPEPCPLRGSCRLRIALAQAQKAFFASLDELTIADIVQDPTASVLLTLAPPPRKRAEPPCAEAPSA